MIELNFENCLQLLLEVEGQCLEAEDISLLKVKLEQWKQRLFIELFQENKQTNTYAFIEYGKMNAFNNIAVQGYVFIALPHSVEQEIDFIWQQSPSKAWLLTELAQSICHVAATKILGAQTCLPLPVINQQLGEFMKKFGMLKAGHLSYKFALFSFYPARETCTFCALKANCPKI